MAIAILQYEGVGARTYAPEGPIDITGKTGPLPSFRPGEVVGGDAGAEFVYAFFTPTAGLTLNQGDVLSVDNTGQAYQLTTSAAIRGNYVATFFLNGRYGDPGTASNGGNIWSYTFPSAGVYGIWVQRAGFSLVNFASSSVVTGLGETTATASQVKVPATATVSSKALQGLYFGATSGTFTANTTSGSATLTSVSSNQGLEIGMGVSGTGIPAGAFIAAIAGSTITLGNVVSGGSALATATNTGTTITWTTCSFTANTVNGSPTLTNISNISGVFPNQTISGTGVSGTIVSINGVPGAYTITLSANATATGTSVTMTTSQYTIGALWWPIVDKTN